MADTPIQDSPIASPTAPAPQLPMVNVVSPEGQVGSLPADQVADAMSNGYQQATPEQVDAHFKEQKYGTGAQQAVAGLEGAAEGVAGPLAPMIEQSFGVPAEDIRGRKEVNPGTHGIGQAAGLVGGALTGAGEGALLGQAGEAAAHLLPEATTAVAKIGSAAVKGAVENALFDASDEASKAVTQDPNQSVETAVTSVGLSGLIGAGIGGAFGSVSPLWNAAMGSNTGGVLKALANKMGGIEGAAPGEISDAIAKSGMDIAPDVRARLTGDSSVQQMSSTLEQSDTTSAGLKHQASIHDFRSKAGDSLIDSLGRTPEAVASLPDDLSHAATGQKLGETLAKEYHEKLDPLSKEFETLKEKYKDAPLMRDSRVVESYTPPSYESVEGHPQVIKLQAELDQIRGQRALVESEQEFNARNRGVSDPSRLKTNEEWGKLNDKEVSIQDRLTKIQEDINARNAAKSPTPVYTTSPGTASVIADKLSQLAQKEQWIGADNDIEREFNRVLKRLPQKKTLSDLSGLMKQVGTNTSADPLNFELKRAGSLMRKVIQDAQDDLAIQHLGAEGPELVTRFKAARDAYRVQSQLKESLDDSLHVGGSTSGFGKSLRERARTDGEAIARRLSGKGDAYILKVLEENFPKTAQLVREFHIDSALKTAADKAKPGEAINSKRLISVIQGMSPELRNFAIPGAAQERMGAIGTLLDQFEKTPHNFSNTARTMDKLMGGIPGSAVGMATLLTSHNPALAGLMGILTKTIGRDAPDAIRLATLKFLGSSQPVEAEGFKSAVDYIHHAIQGEALIARTVKNVFKAGTETLTASQMPSEASRKALNKTLLQLQTNSQPLFEAGNKAAYYMPDHGQAMGQTTGQAVAYLNSIRPNTDPAAPLDTKREPSAGEKAAFDRALDIAQQPLLVIDSMGKGRLVPTDIKHLQAMYPALYSKLQTQLNAEMTDAISKGKTIPYRTRMGLSLFLGQPLDSTMTPAGIMAAQLALITKPSEVNARQQQGQQGDLAPKKSTSALNKMGDLYQTPTQRAQKARSDGHS